MKTKRFILVLLLTAVLIILTTSIALADLRMFVRNTRAPVTFFGRGGFSADGLGQHGPGGTLQAEVSAGSTVELALLYGAYFFDSPTNNDRTLNFDGANVTLNLLTNVDNTFLFAARADVTDQVALKVGSGGGTFDFAVNSDPPNLNGVALVVIFSNPNLPLRSIALLDGGLGSSPQETTANFAAPISKGPDFAAVLSLGIQHGNQDEKDPDNVGGSHLCGTEVPMFSRVEINGTRLTSCAGNLDDGVGRLRNGNLITVGGVGDNTANPADPFQEAADGQTPRVEDDELYNISGFINNGDTKLTINTHNPSGDDLVFFAVISVTALFNLGKEDCFDGIDNDSDNLIDALDPDCILQPRGADAVVAGLAPLNMTPRIYIDEKDTPGLANADRRLVLKVKIENPGTEAKSFIACPMFHVHDPREEINPPRMGYRLDITESGRQVIAGPWLHEGRTFRFPFPEQVPFTLAPGAEHEFIYSTKLRGGNVVQDGIVTDGFFPAGLETLTRAQIESKILNHWASPHGSSSLYVDFFFNFQHTSAEFRSNFKCPQGANTTWHGVVRLPNYDFVGCDPGNFCADYDWYDFSFTNNFSTVTAAISLHTSATAGSFEAGTPVSAFLEVTPNCFLVECPPTPATVGSSGLPTVVWNTAPPPGELFVIDEAEKGGTMTLNVPSAALPEGAVIHFTITMKEAGTGNLLSTETKRFALDRQPPAITAFNFTADDETGNLSAATTVLDEASSIAYVELLVSQDGGITYAGFPMAWQAGDFLNPTLYEATVGPLSPGEAIVKIRAVDEAGNSSETPPQVVGGSAANIVAVDIKPGRVPNTINIRNRRTLIPVAILTTEVFDATTVDALSVRFGANGATESHGRRHLLDVDRDGDRDLLLHFRLHRTGIQCGDFLASLTGETLDGRLVVGSDSIFTIGCRR